MCKMKATKLPVGIYALGVIKKVARSTIEKISGMINLEKFQETTQIDIARILRRVLSIDLWTLFILRPMD